MKDRIILRELKFESRKFKWELEFRDSITIVMGDSGTGKTYLFNMLEKLSRTGEMSGLVCYTFNSSKINERSKEVEREIKNLKGKLIVIDHSDLLLNKNTRRFIGADIHNQYLLLGRSINDIANYPDQMVELDCQNNRVKFNWFMD